MSAFWKKRLIYFLQPLLFYIEILTNKTFNSSLQNDKQGQTDVDVIKICKALICKKLTHTTFGTI